VRVSDYDAVQPKQLSKLARAAWEGDEAKLAGPLKRTDVNASDREDR
jgi:hypothetical protein